jgi:hypothetical protein
MIQLTEYGYYPDAWLCMATQSRSFEFHFEYCYCEGMLTKVALPAILFSKRLICALRYSKYIKPQMFCAPQFPCISYVKAQFNNAIGVQLPTGILPCLLPVARLLCAVVMHVLSYVPGFFVITGTVSSAIKATKVLGPYFPLRFSCRILLAILIHAIRQRVYKVASNRIPIRHTLLLGSVAHN